MKTLSTLLKDDTLMDSHGSTYKVLARIDDLIARSCMYPRYHVFSEWIAVQDLEERGFKALTEGKEVLTRKEAEDILNITIED